MPVLCNPEKIKKFEKILNMTFANKILLERALTHKSFPNENKKLAMQDNERLEFLGDVVLSITVSTYIFKKFPNYSEGELAKMRAVIVSAPILARKAREISLGQYLFLGKGEELTGGRERDSILADALEAVFGAIYLDKGFKKASRFVLNLMRDIIQAVNRGEYLEDYKTMLQEIIQQDSLDSPEYVVVEEKGPDHNKTFIIKVVLQGNKLGEGTGSSKKEAEQMAAEEALKNMGKL